MKKPRRVYFRVSFVLPEGTTVQAAAEYVDAAVASWHGSLHPPGAMGEDDEGNPMFDLDGDTVGVVAVKKPKGVKL